MFRIKGYEPGANITVLNTIYHKSRKDPETGKYGKDSIDIIFKDLDTGQKKIEHIVEPTYTYYIANDDVQIPYNQLFTSKDNVHPVICKYRDLLKDIAEKTNNTEFFYDNIKNGNYRENNKLLTIPKIFGADTHIEDFYRAEFDRTYKNDPYVPSKLYFDIEVDGKNMRGDFPQPGECPINAVTLVDDLNKQVYTLLLNNPDNPLIAEFAAQPNLTAKLKDFVRKSVGGWKQEKRFGLDVFEYHILFYDEEIKLIYDMFKYINMVKPDFALAWNIAFDLPYIIERIRVLGYDPLDIICHPDFKEKECYYYIDKRAQKFEERGDYAAICAYTIYLDQLITFASRRKGQKKGAITSYKLDFVGSVIAKVRKLDYSHITHSVIELPYLNYEVFAFYNVMDTIVQLCIERKVGDIDFVFNKALTVNTRFSKVHRQTTYLVNRGIKDFYDMGYVMGNNINKSNEKEGFAGAFVADPTLVSDKPKVKINGRAINICDNLDDFDYKALYPSIIDESNMAPNTQHGKILLPEKLDAKENRFNNEYFDRSVWFVEDLVCHNRLDFCQRYLHLAGYEEMYDDIIKYFSTIENPAGRFRYSDPISGKRYMYHIINNQQNRIMCRISQDGEKRRMCFKVDKMPNGILPNVM
jgi:DNA polymerase elongation subunit (family B)